jgi:hypothetical protein
MILSRLFRRAATRLPDAAKETNPAGPQTDKTNGIHTTESLLRQEKPMQDKHTSTTGTLFPRMVSTKGRDYRRSGPNMRNGLYNYESAQGEVLQVAQVQIKYVAERGSALGNVVDNEAMTDILIKKSSNGSLVIDELPPSASDRLKVGDIWLVCDIEEDSGDPEAFPSAAGACRLRNGTTEDPKGNGKPVPSPRHADDFGQGARGPLPTLVDPKCRYQGTIGALHPNGYGFIHGTHPRVHRDPFMGVPEVTLLRRSGAREGDFVSFMLLLKDETDEKGRLLTACDIQLR